MWLVTAASAEESQGLEAVEVVRARALRDEQAVRDAREVELALLGKFRSGAVKREVRATAGHGVGMALVRPRLACAGDDVP